MKTGITEFGATGVVYFGAYAVFYAVAHAAVANYDTIINGKENYDDYIVGRVASKNQAAGSQPWCGQPIRTHVERAITRV
jgi:hypothetical protein